MRTTESRSLVTGAPGGNSKASSRTALCVVSGEDDGFGKVFRKFGSNVFRDRDSVRDRIKALRAPLHGEEYNT